MKYLPLTLAIIILILTIILWSNTSTHKISKTDTILHSLEGIGLTDKCGNIVQTVDTLNGWNIWIHDGQAHTDGQEGPFWSREASHVEAMSVYIEMSSTCDYNNIGSR